MGDYIFKKLNGDNDRNTAMTQSLITGEVCSSNSTSELEAKEEGSNKKFLWLNCLNSWQ